MNEDSYPLTSSAGAVFEAGKAVVVTEIDPMLHGRIDLDPDESLDPTELRDEDGKFRYSTERYFNGKSGRVLGLVNPREDWLAPEDWIPFYKVELHGVEAPGLFIFAHHELRQL